MENGFDIPVVVFFFNRPDLILQIMDRIAQVKPRRMYLFCDGGRTEAEWELVHTCRRAVEARIDWDCEIIRNYAEKNRGVYETIGKGACWVFQQEEKAIFLEDDNLPEVTFFPYCREMLERYEKDRRVLWVCGTNYLQKYQPADGSSYVFTKHLLPCGWASWASKFPEMYDGDLQQLKKPGMLEKLRFSYENKALFRQQIYNMEGTWEKLRSGSRVSWDHQMCFSIRASSAYGISPMHNQIRNIGADERSTHGGTGMHKVMTRRFCGIESYPLDFPLVHPDCVMMDPHFEQATANIILMPLGRRFLVKVIRIIKPLFGFGKYESVSLAALRNKLCARKK